LFQIKKTNNQGAEGGGSDSENDYSNVGSPFDHIAVYKQMLELMKPGESVAKSLRRLGEFITTVSIQTSSLLFTVFYVFFLFHDLFSVI
jgi:hypothetical protein